MPPPPPSLLPPLQPFGRCVTRRFLPTWRPGQVGGDGGQFAAAAGANPHSSQSRSALAGPLSHRRRHASALGPQQTAARAEHPPRRGSERPVRGAAEKRPPTPPRAGSRGQTDAALDGRPLDGRRGPRRPSPARRPLPLARPFLILPLPSTPPLSHRHPLSFLSSLPSPPPPLQPLGAAGRTSRRRLLLRVHV